MTEQEWLHCDNPLRLLAFLNGKVSERKLRLFVVGCFRRWRDRMSPEGQTLLALTERLADGQASDEEADETLGWAVPFIDASRGVSLGGVVAEAFALLPFQAAVAVANFLAQYRPANQEEAAAESRERCRLVRHIFGNPFQPRPLLPELPGAVTELAEAIYGGVDAGFALGDMLFECAAADLADHFRAEDWHPKGCWAIDLLTGRTDCVPFS